jgi:ribosomal protein L7/L12
MQPSEVLILLVIGFVVVLGVVLGAVARKPAGRRPVVPIHDLPLSEETLFRVRQLLGEGKKIQAIKEARESLPGLGLKEAKELVEAIEAGHEPPAGDVRLRAGGSHELALRPELLFRIRQLLGERKKIQAIKELRDEQHGLSLKEAKELVEAIEAGHEPPVLDAAPAADPAAAPSSDLAQRARQLRDSGQETLAIRLVCDETGMGILDAQKFVQSLS